MNDVNRPRLDALLDLLADEVAERLAARPHPQAATLEPPPDHPPGTAVAASAATAVPAQEMREDEESEDPAVAWEDGPVLERNLAPPSKPALHVTRLALGILLAAILINIPLNAQGLALARSIPSSASLVQVDGLLVKEETSPDIWVYRNEAFHWISSLDAFDHYRFRWRDVHIVEPGYLDRQDQGEPVHVLLKCQSVPHIYRLEGDKKRWIVDIPTLEADGHVWTDVRMVPCPYLRDLPDGDSIPPGRGAPPPPLP